MRDRLPRPCTGYHRLQGEELSELLGIFCFNSANEREEDSTVGRSLSFKDANFQCWKRAS